MADFPGAALAKLDSSDKGGRIGRYGFEEFLEGENCRACTTNASVRLE